MTPGLIGNFVEEEKKWGSKVESIAEPSRKDIELKIAVGEFEIVQPGVVLGIEKGMGFGGNEEN